MWSPRWDIGVRCGESCIRLPDVVRLRGGVHGRAGGVEGRGKSAVSAVGYMSMGLGDRTRSLPFAAIRRAVVGDSGASGIVNGKP